jgi:hypothetical protein
MCGNVVEMGCARTAIQSRQHRDQATGVGYVIGLFFNA